MTFQEQAKEAIRISGGRITTQREILLDLLATQGDDIDAEQLHRLASAQDPNISLPTIYRTLNTLEAAHIIASRYVSSNHERKVYFIAGQKDVFHFTCRDCGRLIAFQYEFINQLKRDLSAKLGIEVTTLCMCAGGLCADCSREV